MRHYHTTLFVSKPVCKIGMAICLCLMLMTSRAQTLVWEDNFDGPAIDANKWTYDFGDGCERGICGWGNSELEYYTSRAENARIENGNLVIEARQENFQTRGYTSARLKTEGRMHFQYGTLEARIKVPNLQNGLWPAFWMLGTTGNWPANGEMDLMEMGSAAAISAGVINRRAGAAVHWDYQGSQADYGQDYNSSVNLNNDYHVYKLTWDPSFIRVYIDNVQFFAFDISNISGNSLEEFHIPHYILLNLAVGGSYTGILSSGGITAPLPGSMLVDYIRLYQGSGSQLYVGANHAESGTYGVYTETTPVNNKLTYGVDANLYLWNNLTAISGTPYEGSEVMAFRANAGAWFGMGVATDYKNMSNFASGSLKFHMRTTSTHTFKIGVSSAFGDSWVDFVNGGQQYGLVRDGNWHEVTIPFSAFFNLDLYSVKQMFMLTADPPAANVDFFIDNIYYSGGGGPVNQPPAVSVTSPSNSATFNQGQSITINASASDTDGSVTLVEFYADGAKIGQDISSPYSFTWSGAATGTHTITAKATDNGGASTTSGGVNITVNTVSSLPSPWQTADIGAVGAAGSASYSSGTFTVNGSGADIWGTSDEFRFVYQTLSGNGTITAQVNSLTNTDAWAKAGVMIRNSLNANAAHAMTAVTASNGVAFQRRTSDGGSSTHTGVSGQAAPKWVRVQRSGSTFTSSYSSNGTTWTTIGTATITMGTTVYVGLCVTAHNDGTLCGAAFSNVSIGGTNAAPGVSITSPSNNASFTAPASVTISASASDSDGSVTQVAFYHDGTLIGTDTSSPYSVTWSNVAAGNYTLTAIATDNGGLTTTSSGIAITVNTQQSSTNLALSKPVTVSSTENSNFPGSSAVDGNTGTRWSSAFSDPQWIYVDLGATYSISRVKITWEAAYGRDYLVQTSSNASSWTTIKTISGNTTLTNDHTGLNGSGRYVRIYGTVRGTAYGYSIYELEVYGASSTGGLCTGTAVSGDYSYEVSTSSGTVNWRFIPLAPIQGSTLCIIYIKVGNGGYAGFPMTASGSDFTFSQAQTNGNILTFYFTYRVGNTTTERNSSANPHTYTVGTTCGSSGARISMPDGSQEMNEESVFEISPNPVERELHVRGLTAGTIRIIDVTGREVMRREVKSEAVDVSALPGGLYIILINKERSVGMKRFIKK